MKPLVACLASAILISLSSSCAVQVKDPVEKRVEEILHQMTIDEKIGQMNQLSYGGNSLDYDAAVREGKVGSFLNIVDPAVINRLQKVAIEESRLGIPLLVGRDVIHGFKTIFPIPLGLAATFDPELVEKGARLAAVEAASAGVRWTFSPMLDVCRDPRWGRVAEGSGEDPYMAVTMGTAMVRGYQSDDFTDPTSLAACAKHFVGYGASEAGKDYNSTFLPERLLRNLYFPPFLATIDAGALTLMTAFNSNDGVPATGDDFNLRQVLRDEWQFDGLVVSDWNSIGEMIPHGYAADRVEAAKIAVNAGVDMDMMTWTYLENLKKLVEEGSVSEDRIDEAVRNILRTKIKLGLFENPYTDLSQQEKVLYAPAHLEAAKQSAIESAILLKNDNETLPLNPKEIRSILVTGPLADAPHDQLGTWIFDGDASHTVTVLTALKEQYGKDIKIVYYPALANSRDSNTKNLAKVTALARTVDAVLVFAGEEAILSGEAHCLADLNLLGAQSELIEAAAKGGKPVVTVIMAGRPLTIERDVNNSDALLYSFHPGTMGGPALVDLIFGRAVPSGKCPITFPKMVGQIPIYYSRYSTGRPIRGTEKLLKDITDRANQNSLGDTSYHLDAGVDPLFPFGFGLSYSDFELKDLHLSAQQYAVNDTIRVSVNLVNKGAYKAAEVVQLYVRDLVGSIVRPIKELKAYKRVELAPGETREVQFAIPVAELAFYGKTMEYCVEPGDFQLWVAGDSASGRPLSFSVL